MNSASLRARSAIGKTTSAQPVAIALRGMELFGLIGVLYENDAARLLHGANADRAVGAAAGKNDREAVSVLRRKRTEEQVDGRPQPSRLG